MLNRLIIKNIALIDSAEIEFGPKLNVLSGETGSGKSILLDSINFALGAKADKSMIRYGENECAVTAIFSVSKDNNVFNMLDEMGIDIDDEMIITRRFRADGRGDIKVNGCAVNAAMLKKITSQLVDVHGQSEHFYLLNESNQLKVIDKFAGDEIIKLKNDVSDILSDLKNIKSRLITLGGDERERGRRIDVLKYQLDEINEAELKDGEDADLTAKLNVLNNVEKIGNSLEEIRATLGSDNGALDRLYTAKRAFADISKFDDAYSTLFERIENACMEVDDVFETVSSMADELFYDENETNILEKRLDLIKSLKKKYGNSIKEIIDYGESVAEELDSLINCDEEVAKLEKELNNLNSKLYSVCLKLTSLRKKCATLFSEKVVEELKTLNIKNANFCAEFENYNEEDLHRTTQNGLDTMRFMFSANAGEPLKPLSKVISGGEMSRLMLAIKTKTSDVNGIETYIFDEIDAGISGNTAKVVAEKFASIAKQKQIIAVSHLAQISAMADSNFVIYKTETSDGKTVTRIKYLTDSEKTTEIIRLVGGDANSNAAKTLADELIKSSIEFKNKTI